MKKHTKIKIARLFVGLACISAMVANACYDMSGSTTCGGGTHNTLVLCSFPWSWENCTGTGNPVPESTAAVSSTGYFDTAYGIGGCTYTLYFSTGKCCGGAITQETMYAVYTFDALGGYPGCGG